MLKLDESKTEQPCRAANETAYSFQDFTLDLRRGCLRRGEQEIDLRPKSFAVLRHLVENAGRLVPKDELIATVWPNVTVSDTSLARCISDVRHALSDQEQQIIKTVSRRGYLFATPVAKLESGAGREEQFRPLAGERRQLTLMSCDIGGVGLSSRLYPEDLDGAIADCRRRCAEIITRHHGHVARADGDGVLAYFGYPEANEHDAKNALRAALELQDPRDTAERREAGGQLQPCIGIATGMLVVGDALAEAGEVSGAGETLTIAARLQALALPGQTVIASGTRGLAGDFFNYLDLGPATLKGLAEPVEIFRVLGVRGREPVRSTPPEQPHAASGPRGRDRTAAAALAAGRALPTVTVLALVVLMVGVSMVNRLTAITDPAPAPVAPIRTLPREPPPNYLRSGEKVLVDDDSCPAGQIKQITGGSNMVYERGVRKPGVPRQTTCI